MQRLVTVVILVLVCNVLAQCPFHPKSTTEDLPTVVREITKASVRKDSSSSDPMQEMNQLLKQNYDSTKQVMLQNYLNEWPLIFMDGTNLVFWRNGNTTAHSVTPSLYTNLKLVCHTSLGTFVLAQNALQDGGNVTSASRSSIEAYLALFPASYDSLSDRGFTPAQLKMSEYVMDISSDLLQQILQDGYVTTAQLKNYSQKAVKPVNELVAGAAKAQLHLCDKLVQEFKKNITTEEWDNLRVVLLGSHMARHGGIFMQYFGKALDTRVSTGERVVYAESLDTKGAMDLLGTHVIDGSVGEYYWNSPVHMHYDVLATAAHDELKVMFPSGQNDS